MGRHDAALFSIRQRRTQQNAESRFANLLPALIGFDELQLAIPWRVGLHQSPPPLHQLHAVCSTLDLAVEDFSANGKQCLIRLSQPRGPVHADNKNIRNHGQGLVYIACQVP